MHCFISHIAPLSISHYYYAHFNFARARTTNSSTQSHHNFPVIAVLHFFAQWRVWDCYKLKLMWNFFGCKLKQDNGAISQMNYHLDWPMLQYWHTFGISLLSCAQRAAFVYVSMSDDDEFDPIKIHNLHGEGCCAACLYMLILDVVDVDDSPQREGERVQQTFNKSSSSAAEMYSFESLLLCCWSASDHWRLFVFGWGKKAI